MTRTSIPAIPTPFRSVIEMAIAGEQGYWKERRDGWRFWLDPVEPCVAVMLFRSGTVDVSGRLADKVANVPGKKPFRSTCYVGWKWTVR